VEILAQICDALEAAHENGIVHRDLKPENVFLVPVRKRLTVKLLDFGIAKLLDGDGGAVSQTQHGGWVGTPLYMSPEQARSRGVDHRTDIYALGVTAYQMIVGRVPFQGETAMDILRAHLTDAPPRPRSLAPEVPVAIELMLLQLLEKNPEHRPTLQQVVARLAESRVPAPPPVMALASEPALGAAAFESAPAVEATGAAAPMAPPINVAATEAAACAAPPNVPAPLEAGRRPRRALPMVLAAAGLVVAGAFVGARFFHAPQKSSPPSAAARAPSTVTPEAAPVALAPAGAVAPVAAAPAAVAPVVVVAPVAAAPVAAVAPVAAAPVAAAPVAAAPVVAAPAVAVAPVAAAAATVAPAQLSLTINVAARIELDGRELATAADRALLPIAAAGAHTLSITAPHRRPYRHVVVTRPGARVELAVTLAPLPPPAPPSRPRVRQDILDPFAAP
jgi:serine/threonine-protein kinase